MRITALIVGFIILLVGVGLVVLMFFVDKEAAHMAYILATISSFFCVVVGLVILNDETRRRDKKEKKT